MDLELRFQISFLVLSGLGGEEEQKDTMTTKSARASANGDCFYKNFL